MNPNRNNTKMLTLKDMLEDVVQKEHVVPDIENVWSIPRAVQESIIEYLAQENKKKSTQKRGKKRPAKHYDEENVMPSLKVNVAKDESSSQRLQPDEVQENDWNPAPSCSSEADQSTRRQTVRGAKSKKVLDILKKYHPNMEMNSKDVEIYLWNRSRTDIIVILVDNLQQTVEIISHIPPNEFNGHHLVHHERSDSLWKIQKIVRNHQNVAVLAEEIKLAIFAGKLPTAIRLIPGRDSERTRTERIFNKTAILSEKENMDYGNMEVIEESQGPCEIPIGLMERIYLEPIVEERKPCSEELQDNEDSDDEVVVIDVFENPTRLVEANPVAIMKAASDYCEWEMEDPSEAYIWQVTGSFLAIFVDSRQQKVEIVPDQGIRGPNLVGIEFNRSIGKNDLVLKPTDSQRERKQKVYNVLETLRERFRKREPIENFNCKHLADQIKLALFPRLEDLLF